MFKERTVLLKSDVFLNCSVDYGTQPDNITIWTLDGELVWINETSKYNVNASGLTVYNVTAEDEGNYTCHVLHVIGINCTATKGDYTICYICDLFIYLSNVTITCHATYTY